ncbi:hypothetical protein Hanom_Chr08g00689631 [Helianthus anomalus]
MLLNKLLFHTLIVNSDEQMVSGIGSESVLNFPNQIDFRYRYFAFSVPLQYPYLPVFTLKYRSIPVPNRTVLGIFSSTHPYL